MGQDSESSLTWVLCKTGIKVLARKGLCRDSAAIGSASNFLMVVKLMPVCFFKASRGESLAGWASATLLCKCVHVVTYRPLLLLQSIGWNQVASLVHTQAGVNIRRQGSCVSNLKSVCHIDLN